LSSSVNCPRWTTAPKPLIANRTGQLFFNDMAPDNPRQHTIDEEVND